MTKTPKPKYDAIITKTNILETWAHKFPSVTRWLGKLQKKSDNAYFLWLFCRWAKMTPEELLALKEDPNNLEAEYLLDRFAATDPQPYTNSVMWKCSITVRSFFRHNYKDLAKEAGKIEYTKVKPYYKPTKEDLRKLYNVARNPRDRALVTFVTSTAIARETLSKITWGHLEDDWENKDIPHISIGPELLKGHGRGKWKGVRQECFLTSEAKTDLITYRNWWQRKSGIEFKLSDKIWWSIYKPWRPISYREFGNIIVQLSEESGVPFSWHDARRYVETALEEARLHPNWCRKIRGRKVRGEEAPYSQPAIEQLRQFYREAVPKLQFLTEPTISEDDRRTQSILDNARLLGMPEEAISELKSKIERHRLKPDEVLKEVDEYSKTLREVGEQFFRDHPYLERKYETKRISKAELLEHLNKGWQFVAQLDEDTIIVRKVYEEENKTESGDNCSGVSNCQRVVSEKELPQYLSEGWRAVMTTPSGKIVIEET